MPLVSELGIQSCSFHDVATLDELPALLAELGVRRLELAPCHLSPAVSQIELKEALAALACARITPSGWGVFPMGKALRDDRRLLLYAQFMGITTVGADPEPERIEDVSALAAEYGVRVAIHNHGPGHRWATIAALQEGLARANAWVGVCLDTGHLLRVDGDPLAALATLGTRILGVHLKDVVRGRDGDWLPCPLGKGALALRPFLEQLAAVGYAGVLSLEHEDKRGNPMAGIKESLAAFAAAAQGLGFGVSA